MRIPYPTETITAVRAAARARGHDLSGRWQKCGLSYHRICQTCKRAGIVVTPAWYPWEQDKVDGRAVRYRCEGPPAYVPREG